MTIQSKYHTAKKRKPRVPLIPVLVVSVLIALCVWQFCSARGSGVSEHASVSTVADSLLQVVTPAGQPGQIVDYTGMRMSFNPKAHIPNWVAWELTADETNGSEPRAKGFQPDPDVPGCAETADYTRSGYDRGHMAPAGDMKWSADAMRETFYLTNICPQVHSLNAGAWKSLEENCRNWARRDSSLIIICGPVHPEKYIERIGATGVSVPTSFFKVILAPYADEPRAIGFVMPNGRVEGGMQACAMSVDEVERITGYDFFASLPDSIENIVEANGRLQSWTRPGRY